MRFLAVGFSIAVVAAALVFAVVRVEEPGIFDYGLAFLSVIFGVGAAALMVEAVRSGTSMALAVAFSVGTAGFLVLLGLVAGLGG